MKFTTINTASDYNSGFRILDPIDKSHSDRGILAAVIMLAIFGVLAVFSAIGYYGTLNGSTVESKITSHLVKLAITLLTIILTSKVDYRIILKWSSILLLISWGLLLYVHLFGDITNGAKRWLSIGGFSFQPSTLASVALILRVSHLLAAKQEYIHSFKLAFVPIMVWIGITCALIAIQDFSTAGILFFICLIVLFVGRMRILHLGAIVLLGILGGTVAVGSSAERVSRIESYISQVVNIPDEEILTGSGYQGQQAQIAIAKGELLGVGIGKSTQRDFLPAPYNDFIYAIIAEEYGLAGSLIILLTYCFILFRGIVITAKKAVDYEGAFLAFGCSLMIALYAFVNAGVATGLLPVTGLPMPFVSYGGTSMLFSGVLIGLILNISKQQKSSKVQASTTGTYSSKFATGYQ
jgi:cell division protein FtsW